MVHLYFITVRCRFYVNIMMIPETLHASKLEVLQKIIVKVYGKEMI